MVEKSKCLSIILLPVIFFLASCNEPNTIKIPYRVDPYYWIYKPSGDTFPGPDTRELIAGKWYEEWVPNDHTIIKGPDKHWHIFGITHPKTNPARVHEGEYLSLHAISPETTMAGSLRGHSWTDLPKVLPPSERDGEKLANHAPYLVQSDNLYYMIYGPSPIRLAISEDLMKWETKGPLFEEPGGARDPSLIYFDGQWHMIFCSREEIRMRSSKDLIEWGDSSITILDMKAGIAPESPSLIRYNGIFYLFVCGWNGIRNMSDITGAYQHKTFVFYSKDLQLFDTINQLTVLDAHAPEIFQGEDGSWYISSAEWPNRGVSVSRLIWE